MGRIIAYILLILADIYFCITDIFKGYYLIAVVWVLLAAYFVYKLTQAIQARKSGGTESAEDKEQKS